MRGHFLPFAVPDLDEGELTQVRETLDSGWLTTGPRAHLFEDQFRDFVGSRFAVSVNSCTAALHLALEAAGVGPNDLVITTPYTFAATAEVIRYFDALPVFVDVQAETLNIDPGQLNDVIQETRRVLEGSVASPRMPGVRRLRGLMQHARIGGKPTIRAVVPVHIAGHPCDMGAINSLAFEHALAVIEDAAHAFPAGYQGQLIGGLETPIERSAVCFSFYATKTLTTAEGGMITTNNEKWAERCRMMRLHGISTDAWKRYSAEGSWYYEIMESGFKYNMPDILAALGLAQLKKSIVAWKRRQEIAKQYTDALREEPALQVPTVAPGVDHAWHLYPIRLNLATLTISRAEFINALKADNIGTSVHFIPLHLHPYYKQTFGYEPADFPIALREYGREISLPIYSRMTDHDVHGVILAIKRVLEKHTAKTVYEVVGY